MEFFEDVLVATDGSDSGSRAVRAGIDFADAFDAAVDVLVVADGDLSVADAERVADDARETGASSRVRVRTNVVEGDAETAIVERATDLGADVVVMGRRGSGGLRERILGGVTEHVMRSYPGPVLSVPAGDPGVGDWADVLVPTDGSEAARAAVRPSAAVAAASGATLHVLSVVDVAREGGAFSAGGVDDAFVDDLVADAREDVDVYAAACEEAAREHALDVEPAVRTGTATEEIAAYVEDAGVDAVVMASEGTTNLPGQLLGSTTDRVLRTVDVPVLVVHPED